MSDTIPQIPFRVPVVDGNSMMSNAWTYYFTNLQSAVIPLTTGPVISFNTRTGLVVLLNSDVTGALGFVPSPIASPAFTGTPTAVTAPLNTTTNQLATTQFVMNQVGTGSAVNQQQVLTLVSLRI